MDDEDVYRFFIFDEKFTYDDLPMIVQLANMKADEMGDRASVVDQKLYQQMMSVVS